MVTSLPTKKSPGAGHRLDPAKIIETSENLARSAEEQFPGSELVDLAVDLAGIARATDQHARQANQPIYAIRAASFLAICASLLGLGYVLRHLHTQWEFSTITDVFESADAGFNLLILLAGTIWFFVTTEVLVKRKKALAFLEELREFIHVIDVTQLYYTPDLYRTGGSPSSSRFDYRYLLCHIQMLTVISNLAPIYARGAANDSIWRAVYEVEMLANAVASKLLSKAETVREMSEYDNDSSISHRLG